MRFRDLKTGERFKFAYEFLGLCRGPWVKTGRRTYKAEDGRPGLDVVKVGTVNVNVTRLEDVR
jgi:hypothetical protein